MKKIFFLLSTVVIVGSHALGQNNFKIGIFNNFLTYDSNGNIVSNTMYNGGYSSGLNVLAQDGFNLMETYWPDPYLLKSNYKPLAQLVHNNNMQLMDHLQEWFKPTQSTPSHTGICQFNAGSSNPYYIGWNYDWLYQNVYNDTSISKVFYAHDMGTEFSYFHYYPIANYGDWWCDYNWYNCYGSPGSTIKLNNSCEASGKYHASEIPPQVLSDAIKYLKVTAYPSITQPISSGLATHNGYVSDGYQDPCYYNVAPCYGMYNPQDYLNFPGVNHAQKPDIINEDSYYNNAFAGWGSPNSSSNNYLGKFINIDYIHSKGYTHIISENDIAREDIHDVYSNPGVKNFNMTRFLTYTAIIHGVDGINFFTLPDSYGGHYDSSHTWIQDYNYDPDGFDKGRFDNTQNTSLPTRFSRGNFPYLYQFYVSRLARELRYLVNNNSITPNNSTNLLYKKTVSADGNNILESSTNYLPATIASVDATDYNLINNYPTTNAVTNNHRGEDHGLRYIITSNSNGEATMIVSNPNPYSVHNAHFDFTGITNPMISNALVVDVLFDDGSVTNVNATNYKTDTSASVEAVTFNLLKKYTLPFCSNNKKFAADFGPFDVKIFNFKTKMDATPAYANGWQNVWTNGGNNTIGNWGGMNNSITTDKFIPIDFDSNGDDELLCVQSVNSGGPGHGPNAWATVLDWNGSAWSSTPMWTNSGNGSFNNSSFAGWGTRAADKYIVGDFDGDGYSNELLCVQGDGAWASILRANKNTMNFDLYWSNNGSNALNTVFTGWGISAADKFGSGDFDNDGKNNDLLCVQGANAGYWAILHFNPSASPANFTWYWGDGSGHMSGWNINSGDQYTIGDLDGDSYRNELLSFDASGSYAASLKFASGAWSAEWITSPNVSIAGWSHQASDKVIVGNVDTDPKDEVMFIQNNSSGWATTEDLNTNSTGMQWNWSNHNSYYTGPMVNYIADWKVNDPNASNVNYLFIRPGIGYKKCLLAFKNYGCGNDLISMYKTNTPSNYRLMSPQQVESVMSLNNTDHGFDFTLYPNPSNGSFVVTTSNTDQKTIAVMDLMGRVVYQDQFSEQRVEVKLPEASKGVYAVKITDGNKTGVKKLVVE